MKACQMLEISRQAIYQCKSRRVHLQSRDEEILTRVRDLRSLMPRVGGRKLLEHCSELGLGRDKFFEILRTHGLLVKRRRTYTVTTNSKHELPVYPNLLNSIAVNRPNQVWVADQTYIRLQHRFCYLSLVTDLYSRKIVGYDVSSTLEATGPLAALRRAIQATRGDITGLIHHSDRGTQYCSSMYTDCLKEHGCEISMTLPRRPDQNAVAERVNGILKTEFYLDAIFTSIREIYRAIDQAVFIYNNIRLHFSLGLTTPSARYAA